MKKELIDFENIKEKIAPIDGSDTDFVSENGNIYKKYKSGKYLKKKVTINPVNHYGYCGITMVTGKNVSHRVHRLVAKAFVENTNNYTIVGHKDNDKSNNIATNLYWTTVSENTQKAYDDGLAKNREGYEDEQSYPVIAYDINMNEIGRYGSVTLCHKALKISKSTVLRHCNGEIKGKSRSGYIFRFQD